MWSRRGLTRAFQHTSRPGVPSAVNPKVKCVEQDSLVASLPVSVSGASSATRSNLRPVAPPAACTGIAVIGGGRMGEIRCRHLNENSRASIAAFVDVNPTQASQFGSQFGCSSFGSLDDALLHNGHDVKGVWVCTPTPHHKAAILAAAERGLHVAVEKPVAMNRAEMQECYEACAKNDVHLHVAFQRQADPAYQRVAEAVRGGELGDMVSAHAVFRDHPVPPLEFLIASGGDPFHDLASHDINYILSLANEQPAEVFASARSTVPELQAAGVSDTAFVMIRFVSGFVATLDLSRSSAYGYDQRFEVFGSNGQVALVDNVPQNAARFGTSSGFLGAGTQHSFPQRFDDAYKIELNHFLEIIEGRRVPQVTADQSYMTFDVCEAAVQSALTGQVVRL